MTQESFTWTFERLGGMNQTVLSTAEELRRLRELNPKLWVALSCPTQGLEFDADTLRHLDTDGDGRVRIPEVLAAVDFVCDRLVDPNLIMEAPDVLTCDQIADPALQNAVQGILSMSGLAATEPLTLAMVRGATDVRAAATHNAWAEEFAKAPLILGESTAEAWSLFSELAPKIDDYFLRCRMSSYAPAASGVLNAENVLAAAAEQGALTPEKLAELPLAHVAPDGFLTDGAEVNPLWQAKIAAFIRLVAPLLKTPGRICSEDWANISANLKTYGELAASEPAVVEGVSASASVSADVTDAALGDLEQLLLYVRHLYRLLCNFISFKEFYSMQGAAAFQVGTLYIDGRACHLCLNVNDPGKHVAIAKLSQLCLVYCACSRHHQGGATDTKNIVAAVTAGTDDFLSEGRNGVFVDNMGRDWDATVIKVERNPISLKDAIWSPYKRVSSFVGSQISKFATSKKDALIAGMTKPAPGAAPFDISKTVSIFAAVGIALGAIGTAVGSIAGALVALKWWQFPFLILGMMILVSGPSVLLAWLKLRKRTLAPLLEASGWAVNSQLPIGITLANALTTEAKLPANVAIRRNIDPFNIPKSHAGAWFGVFILIAALLGGGVWWCWHSGALKDFIKQIQSASAVPPAAAPAPAPAAPPAPAKK